VSSEAREGQHSDVVTKAFVNVIPCAASSRCTFVIRALLSQRWSSARITTRFSRFGAAPAPPGVRNTAHANRTTRTAATSVAAANA
jgi:hypothetical protein